MSFGPTSRPRNRRRLNPRATPWAAALTVHVVPTFRVDFATSRPPADHDWRYVHAADSLTAALVVTASPGVVMVTRVAVATNITGANHSANDSE